MFYPNSTFFIDYKHNSIIVLKKYVPKRKKNVWTLKLLTFKIIFRLKYSLLQRILFYLIILRSSKTANSSNFTIILYLILFYYLQNKKSKFKLKEMTNKLERKSKYM